ncbi:MAG: NUDIX hydrolase [Atopobiaceae bacterium]|nr:NUDIX hydrolase [Atopobiaceae bacterium]
MQEMIDIYDGNRALTGITIPREGAFLTEGQYMLYVLALIEDAKGRFLITQRSMDKHWGAGWWEVTGGGVRAGESSLEAVRREVPEEVGLELPNVSYTPVYSYENVDLKRGDNYFVDIYHIKLDFTEADVSLLDGEAIDFRLASWDEISKLAENGTFLHYERLRQALQADGTL